ncbi:MAG: SDR family NAD(P)-dependent oxidoreductase [Betaproteobacteria bacterium]
MDLQLRGAHALVTGAGRGIGRAIAQRLADEGCQVTLLGRDSPVLAATAAQIGPARAYAVVADVTDRAAVEAALAQARAHFGPLRIVVNNAGAAESAPFAQLDAVQWQRMLDLNLTGAFHVTQAALSDLLAGHGARVVNVASTAALKGYGYVAAYVAAKHGLLGLTRALAAEYAQRDLTVNAVCPGYTDTDLLAAAVQTIAGKTGRSPEDARAELARANPQRRLIRPEEVAAAVAWLCSPAAASVTGQAITIDGGEVA